MDGQTRPGRWRGLALGAVVGAALAAFGCAIGAEQEPGCHTDADCGDGWLCRAGACFQTTTGLSGPVTDGGDAGDDGGDGGDGG